jgi:L-iditol 2-dehydrogenase
MTAMTDQAPSPNNVVACCGGDRTALEARPVPKPGPGELLLRLRVVGLCGTDLFKLSVGSEAQGTVLGHEVVGTVIACGDGVTKFKQGDRIAVPHHVPCGECIYCKRGNETMCETFRENLMFPGGFADTILIRPRAVEFAAHVLPDKIADEAAVFIEPAACVLRGIHRSEITADGMAVIQGAGSMGLLHLLVLKAALPGVTVMMVDPVEERKTFALALGADAAAAPGKDAVEALGTLTEGAGADAVFDTVGGNGPLKAALSLCRQGGSVVLFAHAPAGENADFDLNDLFKYERRIIGTYSGALREQAGIYELIASGALDPSPLATHKMPLDDFERGVTLTRERKALKVLFTPSRETTA